MDMCFACIAAVPQILFQRITVAGTLYHTNIKIVCCVLCMKFKCLIERCGLLIFYIVKVSNRAMCLNKS